MADLDEVRSMAECLLDDHGLDEWTFDFDNAKRRFGQCDYNTSTITLSASIVSLNSMDDCVETILHEIAHALVGPWCGHGPKWIAQAFAIGCNGQRCYDHEVIETVQGQWVGTCPLCGHQVHRHRKPKNTHTACSGCCDLINNGRWCVEAIYRWERS